ncbi:MAG: histidine phosphatase family protein [Hyphomicrobium sp.]|nr:histidine phosphatase family protein [Hyphomicrobium sp.]
MPLIDLIRHGEVEERGLLLGRTDTALSTRGWDQFEQQTANRTWASIRTSPLRRAREPAEKLAALLELPIAIDGDWAEMDFGAWDGRSILELRTDARIAEQLDALYRSSDAGRAPYGESCSDLQLRIRRALAALAEAPESDRILVATHGGPIRAAISIACDIAFERTWAFRIDYGTRVTLALGRAANGSTWGEIIEVAQP